MTYQGSGGYQGVQGDARVHYATFDAKKSDKTDKLMTPNYGLKYPKCALTQKGWYLLISKAFGNFPDTLTYLGK